MRLIRCLGAACAAVLVSTSIPAFAQDAEVKEEADAKPKTEVVAKAALIDQVVPVVS